MVPTTAPLVGSSNGKEVVMSVAELEMVVLGWVTIVPLGRLVANSSLNTALGVPTAGF